MATFNEFRFIGSVYSDARKSSSKEGTYKATFTLATKSTSGQKMHFIPIIAPSYLAEKAFHFCRNGNLISVIGEVMTAETTDRLTGYVSINVFFVATDVLMITKAERKPLREKSFVDDINKMPLEE